MHRLFLLITLLLLAAPQGVNACGLCIGKSISVIPSTSDSTTGVTAMAPGTHDEGLSLSAGSSPYHPSRNCPCCPTDTDCTDCVKCAGPGAAYIIAVSSAWIHLPYAEAVTDSMGEPCSRAIARPGHPPQPALR